MENCIIMEITELLEEDRENLSVIIKTLSKEINDNNYLDILDDLISIYDVIDIMNECLNDKQRLIYIEQLDDDSKEMIIKILDNSI